MIKELETVTDSVRIQQVTSTAYKIPTDAPEADGTIQWQSTTLVIVEINAGDKIGFGFSYADETSAVFINKTLAPLLTGRDAMDITAINAFLVQQIRNNGTTGIAMMAVSAVDNALWDLKARILDLPLCKLLGQVHPSMLLYGSGGFTSYDRKELQQQFITWAEKGIKYMKMKVGTEPGRDVQRTREARDVLSDDTELMIDANGAYTVKQALKIAEQVTQYRVAWFEEPVSSDNLQGLSFIRQHAPAAINIAAGEYGYNLPYFEQMLSAGAVDILQADATRCGGITGFLKAGYLAEAHQLPFSSHCAPALHLHAALALPSFFIAEYFHDHERIEQMFFDGVTTPVDGVLVPDLSRPGLGIEFKFKDAEPYKL
jgi:L-alanine-DL-glutamate epimerase-like enolase superfamily enzyme